MVEHLGLEANSISLQGRSAVPARAPKGVLRGPDPCSACTERWREGSDPREWVVPGVGFEPTSPRLQRGAFTRLASQANIQVGAADGNRTPVCAWATRGSTIELRTLVRDRLWRKRTASDRDVNLTPRDGAQSRTRTCEALGHLIYSQASSPLEYLCGFGCGGRTCTCGLRVMGPASCCCSTPLHLVRANLRMPAPRFG